MVGRDFPRAIDPQDALYQQLAAAIIEIPPVVLRDGGVLAEGYDLELDELRGLSRNADQYR